MIKSLKRPYNFKEQEILNSKKLNFADYLFKFWWNWLFVNIILYALFSLLKYYFLDISKSTELILIIIIQAISSLIVLFILKKNGTLTWNRRITFGIENGFANILKVEATEVVKRDDIFDIGDGFYFKTDKNEVLFLQGQIYDTLEANGVFPNSSFEIVKSPEVLNEIIGINILGSKLQFEKTLKAFSKEEVKKGNVHYNEQVLNIKLNELS